MDQIFLALEDIRNQVTTLYKNAEQLHEKMDKINHRTEWMGHLVKDDHAKIKEIYQDIFPDSDDSSFCDDEEEGEEKENKNPKKIKAFEWDREQNKL